MRRIISRVDQAPAWAFVAAAVLVFGGARAGRLFALLRQSPGGMELGGFLTFATFVAVVIFAVRRRQVSAWRSTVHVLGALVIGNALALALIWPLVPASYGIPLGPLVWDTLTAGAAMAVMGLPLGIVLLWLSRRYGSHSHVTERRTRVVRETLRRRLLADYDEAG